MLWSTSSAPSKTLTSPSPLPPAPRRPATGITEFVRKRFCFWVTNPQRTLVAAWYLSLVSLARLPAGPACSACRLAAGPRLILPHLLLPPHSTQVLVFIDFIIACV